jgi:hypothetical protein
MPKRTNICGWKVMPAQCPSCPFGPDGDPRVRESVMERVSLTMQGSQICHHPVLYGKKETRLCRGSRDIQLQILTAFGILPEPTDQAFEAASKKVLGR